MKLRIHHFFDILRDFGKKEALKPHPYGHSYHKVAEAIRNNPNLKIRIIRACDDVCEGCLHLKGNSCDDVISHREDFSHKQEFNDYLDRRIMELCLINIDEVLSPIQLCRKAGLYLDNMDWIYQGNDPDHTRSRKIKVISGLEEYSKKHKFRPEIDI
jgi:hypothetical protein